MNKKNNILDSIIKISNLTREKKIRSITLAAVKASAKPLADKFKCTIEEAVMFALVFALFFEKGYGVDIGDLARHLGCDSVEILPYEYVLRQLLKRKLISRDHDSGSRRKAQFSYKLKNDIVRAVLSDAEPETKEPVMDNITLLSRLQDMLEQYLAKEINFADIREGATELIGDHQYIYFARKLAQLDIEFELKLFLLYVIVRHYKGDYGISVTFALDELFWDEKKNFHIVKTIVMKNQSVLFEKNIIKASPCSWKNDIEIDLTREGAQYLFRDDAGLVLVENEINKRNERYEIPFEKIEQKELFYNDADLGTIDFITDILKEDNYRTIRSRLSENNMPQGLAVLLHGKPGTGKTETVYQLAKATERNIYRVEISALKSMWFGESQKMIKSLFEDYYAYAEKQTRMPVLFFNEADGVISKRKDIRSSQVAQTENEIQNILLQEMEEFKGILMATTNLMDNIDSAFDRRFLFKVELTVPTAFTRHQIYRSLLRNLNDNELWILAEDFEFSGGVIQNIARKATMHHILHGSYPDIDWYVEACNQEQYRSNTRNYHTIGFKKQTA